MRTLLFAFALCAVQARAYSVTNLPPEIVAVVEGIRISSKEIEVPHDGVLIQYRLVRGQTSADAEDDEKLAEFKEEIKQQRVVAKIKDIIFNKKVIEFGISVSRLEMIQRWEQLTANANFAASVEAQRELLEPLLAALRAVHENGDDKNIVYERTLRNRMSATEWEVHVNYYSTLKRRQILEQAIAQSDDDLKRPDPGVQGIIIREKMNERIDAEISVQDTRFRQYRDLLVRNTDHHNLDMGELADYIAVKRAEWWLQQYRNAQVEIGDSTLRDAWSAYLQKDASR